MEKRKQFPYIWAGPFITLFIMLVLYAISGIFPFGSGTTAVVDGIGQYIPFIAEFSEKLREGESLFFTWHAGMGVNFWVNIAYYLSSPFSLIALFFDAGDMDKAFALITLLKPFFLALTFSIFLKYAYKKNDFSIVVFSVLWALSGFMTACMCITSWYDSIIYFPLVILGLKRFMDGKSAIIYSIFLGLSIISNFYIGWIICIFCVIYFIYSFIADDDIVYEGKTAVAENDSEDESAEDNINIFAVFSQSYLLKTFFKFIGASLLAGAFSAVFSLPTLFTLQNTVKGSTETQTVNFNSLWAILASHIVPAKNTYNNMGSYDVLFAFVGIATVILAIAYFFTKGISLRKKLANLFLLAVMWVSITFFAVYTVWHGFGVPVGFMYRFAFVYGFVLLKIAFEAYIEIKNIPIYGIFAGTFFALICVSGIYFDPTFKNNTYSPLLVAEIIALITVFTVILCITAKKVKFQKVMTFVLAAAVLGETVMLNWENVCSIDITGLLGEKEVAQNAAEMLQDGEYMHFENKDDSFHSTVPYGTLFGYNALQYYSSMADGNFSITVAYLGANGNSQNSQNGPQEQTPIFNMLFPTKYYLDGSGDLSENYYRKEVKKSNGYALYELNYTMPFMYTVSRNISNWDPFSYGVMVDNQNSAFKGLTGTDENALYYCKSSNFAYENCAPASAAELLAKSAEEKGMEYGGEYDKLYEYMQSRMSSLIYRINDKKKECKISFDVTAENDGMMYIMLDVMEFVDVTVKINGKEFNYYVYGDGDGRTFELGEVKAGDTAQVTIGGYKKDGTFGENLYGTDHEELTATSFVVDKEIFDRGYSKLDAMSDTEMLEFSDTKVKAKVTSYEDGYLYIPTSYDEGWKITIDGNKVPLYEHESHILMTEITKGEHVVEMKYCPQGFVTGAVVTGVCIAIFIAWAVILKKRNNKLAVYDTIEENADKE